MEVGNAVVVPHVCQGRFGNHKNPQKHARSLGNDIIRSYCANCSSFSRSRLKPLSIIKPCRDVLSDIRTRQVLEEELRLVVKGILKNKPRATCGTGLDRGEDQKALKYVEQVLWVAIKLVKAVNKETSPCFLAEFLNLPVHTSFFETYAE